MTKNAKKNKNFTNFLWVKNNQRNFNKIHRKKWWKIFEIGKFIEIKIKQKQRKTLTTPCSCSIRVILECMIFFSRIRSTFSFSFKQLNIFEIKILVFFWWFSIHFCLENLHLGPFLCSWNFEYDSQHVVLRSSCFFLLKYPDLFLVSCCYQLARARKISVFVFKFFKYSLNFWISLILFNWKKNYERETSKILLLFHYQSPITVGFQGFLRPSLSIYGFISLLLIDFCISYLFPWK